MNNTKLTEIKRLRKENTKVFRDENGIYQMRVYPNNIHYYDNDSGSFEENNSVYKKTDNGYKLTNGKYDIEFLSDNDTPQNLKITIGDMKVEMCFDGISSGKKKICLARKEKLSVKNAKFRAEPGAKLLDEEYSHAIFNDVCDGVDIEYLVHDNTLKENIIIKKALPTYEFDFTIATDNLIMRTDNENRLLALFDKRTKDSPPYLVIPGPYMTDAAGERSDNVYYKVKRNHSGEYKLTIVASEDWINREERVFPIKVDPTYEIFVENEPTCAADMCLRTQMYPSGAIGNSGKVGFDKYGNEYQTDIYLNVPDIGKSTHVCGGVVSIPISKITGPIPYIAVNNTYTEIDADSMMINYPITAEDMEWWYNSPYSYYTPVISLSAIAKGVQNPGANDNPGNNCPDDEDCPSGSCPDNNDNSTNCPNGTNLDSSGNNNSGNGGGNDFCEDNCGSDCYSNFSLRNITQTITSTTINVGVGKSLGADQISAMSITPRCDGEQSGSGGASGPSSSEYYDSYITVSGACTTAYHGYVVVYYTDDNDYMDNQEIVYPEHGTYNSEFINLHTGILSLKHDDIATDGAIIPVSVSHYYRSVTRTDEENEGANCYHCGNGWKMSIQQRIERDTSDSATEYIYVDAGGKRHYFVKNADGKIVDTGGLHLTFTGTYGVECRISDRGGNTMTFDGKGRLVKVSDRCGNTAVYTYENDKLMRAVDSFGRATEFTYENELLREICDGQMRRVKFFYSGKDLVRIEDADGMSSSYTYDNSHHITEVLNPDGVKVVYTYENNGDRVIRTQKYTAIVSTAHEEITECYPYEAGEFNTFEYRGTRSTAVCDRSGIRHVYVFDESGRTEFEYEDSLIEGTKEKGQVTGTALYSYADKKRVFSSSISASTNEAKNFVENGTFENDADCAPAPEKFEKIGGSTNDCVTSMACIDGTKSFMFCGGNYEKYLKQTINITNDPNYNCDNRIKFGDTLVLSAWAKASASTTLSNSVKFEIRALAHYTDNTSETISASYDAQFDGWQYAALPIRADKNKTLQYVSIYLDCSYNTADIFFDNISLVNALGESLKYEEDISDNAMVFGDNINIVQRITSHNGIMTTVTENNAMYLPARVTTTDLDGNSFATVYKYDTKGNIIATQDYRGTVTLNDYSDKGQLLKTRMYHSDAVNTAQSLTCPDDCFVKEYNYDKNSEFLKNETDARSGDIKTQYDYDEDSGLLNYVTDANGVRTTYAYDHATKAMTMASTSVGGQNNSVAYGYTNRLLTAITHNGFEYKFEYDGFARQTKITAGGELIAQNEYTLTDTTTVTTTYATGEAITVTTDRHQAPIKKTYYKPASSDYTEGGTQTEPESTEILVENEYDEIGKLTKAIDKIGNVEYNYTYDELGNIIGEKRNGTAFKSLEYDKNNRLVKTTVSTSDQTLTYTPVYETRKDGAIYPENALKGMVLDGIFEETVTKDKHQRVQKKALKACGSELLGSHFTYLKEGNRLTSLVDTVYRYVNGYEHDKLRYKYDNNGNITEVYRCTYNCDCTEPIYEYKYDGLNRLIRENDRVIGRTYTYSYDAAGNILCKRTYNVTSGALVTPIDVVDYTYENTGWKDKLTSYNGSAITYDKMGNPVYYRGHNLKWGRVRLLTQWDDLTFSYNANGIRTRKGNTYYELDGSNIISETKNGKTIRYYYGNDGITAFRYNGEYYYYEKNLQGDITGIYDGYGNNVAEYAYDAWGNCTILADFVGIAQVNPFRYRGYYYDSETGLYYLKSRYYDPQVGRFVNADDVGILAVAPCELTDKNLYIYCDNNPISRKDDGGKIWDIVFDLFSLGVSVIEVCINPTDMGAWIGLAGDLVDVALPGVSGIGELIDTARAAGKTIDTAKAIEAGYTTIKISKATDLTEDAMDAARKLEKVGNSTKSTREAGIAIHKGYKSGGDFIKKNKEYGKVPGIRPDYYDKTAHVIYELKPGNVPNLKKGSKQLMKYNAALGNNNTLILELY